MEWKFRIFHNYAVMALNQLLFSSRAVPIDLACRRWLGADSKHMKKPLRSRNSNRNALYEIRNFVSRHCLLIVTKMGYYLPSLKIIIIKRAKTRVDLLVAKAGLKPIKRING